MARRSFLGLTAAGAAVASVAGLAAALGAPADDTLAAAYEAVTDESDPARAREAVARMRAFAATLPRADRLELEGGIWLLERSPFPLIGAWSRFSRLDAEKRRAALTKLRAAGPLGAALSGGLRELCLLAHYTDPRSWDEIGYTGPMVPSA